MKEEIIEINVPMEAFYEEPELIFDRLKDEFDNAPYSEEDRKEILHKYTPSILESISYFLVDPSIERRNAVRVFMNMYLYWAEKEVNE